MTNPSIREIELLRETMTLYGLSPERAGKFLDVPGITIRRWLKGETMPGPIYLKAIVEGVKKIDAEFGGRLEMKEIRPGVFVSKAWWGSLVGDPDWTPAPLPPEAVAADENALADEDALLARIAEAGAKLKEKSSGTEAEDLGAAWDGFVRVVRALHERGIELQV